MFKKIFFLFFIISFFFLNFNYIRADEREDLNNKISEYIQKLNELGSAKNTLANQIKIIDSQVQLTLLKITQTESSINLLEDEISNLTVKIDGLDTQLNQLTSVLIQQISQNYKLQKRIPLFAFFVTSDLNNYLIQHKYVSAVQKNNQDNMLSLETVRTNYDLQKAEKTKKQQELETLQKTLASQKISLAKQKTAKNNLLEVTKNDEKKYQQLLTEAQNQLRQLRSFSSTAGGSSCLSSSPGSGSDGLFFSQRDPAWCKQFMGNSQDTIGEVGCYISSISMVFKKLGNNINPSIYASDPSNFTLSTAYAKTPNPPSGYEYQQVGYSSNTVDNELKSGRFVIAQIRMSSSISGMHFIVLISGSNGNYKMHDPWYGPDLNFSDHYSTSSIMSLRLFKKV